MAFIINYRIKTAQVTYILDDMASVIMHTIWRFFIGCVAIFLLFIMLITTIPYFAVDLPILFVLIALYIVVSYFCIPAVIRTWRRISPRTHLPVYAVSSDGWSSDPINIAILTRNKAELQKVMQRAGWTQADPSTLKNNLREAYAMIFRRPYTAAPFSKLYLFGRPHDIGFQIQPGSHPSPRHRHHIRLWKLSTDETYHSRHDTFWHATLKSLFHKKKEVWIGAATYDIALFAVRVQNLQITHKIDHETTKERDFVIASLRTVGAVRHQSTINTGEPLSFRGQTFGVTITVDGNIEVVELR